MIEFSEDKKLIDERTKQNLQSVYLQIKDELMGQKDPQLQKKLRISVTLLVSHLDKSPLNFMAPLNIWLIFVTFDTSQVSIWFLKLSL